MCPATIPHHMTPLQGKLGIEKTKLIIACQDLISFKFAHFLLRARQARCVKSQKLHILQGLTLSFCVQN